MKIPHQMQPNSLRPQPMEKERIGRLDAIAAEFVPGLLGQAFGAITAVRFMNRLEYLFAHASMMPRQYRPSLESPVTRDFKFFSPSPSTTYRQLTPPAPPHPTIN